MGVEVLDTASRLAAALLLLGAAKFSLLLLVANVFLEGRAPLTICLWFSDPPGTITIGLP